MYRKNAAVQTKGENSTRIISAIINGDCKSCFGEVYLRLLFFKQLWFKILLQAFNTIIFSLLKKNEQKTKQWLFILQYEKKEPNSTFTLQWIFLLVGCLTGFVFFITVLYVTWWYSQKRHLGIFGTQGYLSNRHLYRLVAFLLPP